MGLSKKKKKKERRKDEDNKVADTGEAEKNLASTKFIQQFKTNTTLDTSI